MNLCKCSNCDNIIFDENPQVEAPEYSNEDIKALAPLHMEKNTDDPENSFWMCPICLTDDFLTDDI